MRFVKTHRNRRIRSVSHFAVIFATLGAAPFASTGFAQVAVTGNANTTPPLLASYPSLVSAITALNATTAISGPVVITLTGNETAPVAGYSITATPTGASSTNNITIQGSGSTITAFSPQAAGVKTDAIFKIIGSDFITLQNFTMQENAANTTTAAATNNMTEFGVALFLASATNGAQNNTIQNNTITLGSTYQNAIGIFSSSSSSSTNGALAATSTAGTNSNNKFYGNTISSVAYGMYCICEPITATINESGNDVGGISAATGNTITFGKATTSDIALTRFSATTAAGIYFRNGVGDSVRFNSITSNSLAYPQTSGITGIYMAGGGTTPTGVTYTSTIGNNSTINITNTGTTPITGIDFGDGISTGTIAGSNNSVTINQTATAANSAAVIGIKANYTSATNTCNSNTVILNQSETTGTLSGAATGMTLAGTATTTITANSNNVTLNATGSGTGTITGAQTALSVAGTSTINTANTNTILFNQTTSVATGITTGAITGIVATSAASTSLNIGSTNQITVKQAVTGAGTYGTNAVSYVTCSAAHNNVNITNNTFNTTGSTVRSTGSLDTIVMSGTTTLTGTLTITGNTVNIDRVATSGAVGFYTQTDTTPNDPTDNISSNNITFTSLAGVSTATVINRLGGSSSGTRTVSTNTISVSGTNTGTVIGIVTGWGSTATMSTNSVTINSIGSTLTGISTNSNQNTALISSSTLSLTSSSTAPTAMTGISVAGSGAHSITGTTIAAMNLTGVITASPTVSGIVVSAGTGANISGNTLNNISIGAATSSSSPVVDGIVVSGGTSVNVFKNKVCDITTAATGTSTIVSGIRLSGGTTNTIYNNLIGNLTAPASASIDSIRGINITSTTTSSTNNVYYNTVNLAAASSGANFGTTGIFHTISTTSTTAALNLRNNVIVNTSTPNGTGRTVAYRRSAGAAGNLANYASTSNNNDFYAGTPGTTRLIYSDGTSTAQTMTAYQTGVFTAGTIAPRDSASFTENPTFLGTTCGNANFLHINTTVSTQLESGAVNISGFTDDFDGDIRQGNSGYAGTGSAPDVGADEFNGPPRGACCLPSNTCTQLTNSDCTAQSGCWQGANVSCSSPNTIFSQNFDGVTAPTLPASWSATNASGTGLWVTSASGSPSPSFDSSPNAAFIDDPVTLSDKRLDSPSIAIPSGVTSTLSFRNNYDLESGFDGGVLEISIGGGAFTDIVTAGGSFTAGGYNGNVSSSTSGPFANSRAVWTGSSSGFITTTATLPAAAAGQNIVLRWRMGSDTSLGNTGWRIDSITITTPQIPCPVITTNPSNQTVCNGGSATFTVVATGSSLTYQWRKGGSPLSNGGNISGAMSATLTIISVGAGDAGSYDCVVTSGNCSKTSTAATLTAPPTTATVGGAQTICVNGTTSGLGGNTPTNGTGAWSIVTGGFTGTFSPNNTTGNATFTQTGGGAGNFVLRWTISNSPCTPSTADVTITANALPNTPTGVGASPNPICPGDATTLSGTVNAGETIDWYTGSCGGTLVNSGTSIIVSPSSTTTYFARARNTTTNCASAACASVTVNVSTSPTLDGTADSPYGSALATQLAPTLYGDSTSGNVGCPANGSELDQAFGIIRNGTLYLTLAGNLQTNFNRLLIFFDSQSGGQNVLRGDNDGGNTLSFLGFNGGNDNHGGAGLTFDSAFSPDYSIGVTLDSTCFTLYADYFTLPTSSGGSKTFLGSNTSAGGNGALSGGTNPNNIKVTINNSNTAGVTGSSASGASSVTTGVELAIPLAAIGSPSGSVNVCAMIASSDYKGLSNQVLGSLTSGGVNYGFGSFRNFSSDADATGNQYFTVPVSNTAPSISVQPSNASVCVGGNASFSVTATGTGTLTYQWRRSTTNLTDGVNGNGTTVSGATSATLNLTNVHTGDAGSDYNVVITNGCGSTTSTNATLTVATQPTSSNGGNQTICQGGTTTGLGGNNPSPGTGLWSVFSGGTGTFNPNASTANATFTPSSGTSIILKWTVSNPPCADASSTLTVTINSSPTSSNGGDQTICQGGTTAGLGGNDPSPGTGLWSVFSGGTGTFNPNASTANATFTPSSGTSIVLKWTVSNPPCANAESTLTITVKSQPSSSNGGNQSVCEGGTTAGLGGNDPSPGTGLWSVFNGGTGTFNPNASTANATFTPSSGTSIVLKWTVSNPPCPNAESTLAVTVISACDDGNECTSDTCVNGTCQYTPVADNTACNSDNDPCTTDVCLSGVCTHVLNTCSGHGTCDSQTGNCNCDPGWVGVNCDTPTGSCCTHPGCTSGITEAACTGPGGTWTMFGTCSDTDNDGVYDCDDLCPNTPNGESVNSNGCSCSQLDCNDNDACTDDSCDTQSATCVHSTHSCDDGNACTTDTCNPADGCHHDAVSGCCNVDGECNDSDACTDDSCNTTTHTCEHSAHNCNDNDPCTTDTCNPADGCHHAAVPNCCHIDADCDDNDPCTTDSCVNNSCQHDPIPNCGGCNSDQDCDDTDPYTIDTCNSGQCYHTPAAQVAVQLGGAGFPATLSRCIRFELYKPGCDAPEVVDKVLTFTNGMASGVQIPTASGPYSCIAVRDKLHTLRRVIDLSAGPPYSPNFTGSKALLGGNLNDDYYCDILDYAVFASRYGVNYGTGDTTCSTAAPNADISGDGTVGTQDFTFIQINFLALNEPTCCDASGNRPGPITDISVAELRAMGLGNLAVADLNRDGRVNQLDVAAYAQGARPRHLVVAPGTPTPLPPVPGGE